MADKPSAASKAGDKVDQAAARGAAKVDEATDKAVAKADEAKATATAKAAEVKAKAPEKKEAARQKVYDVYEQVHGELVRRFETREEADGYIGRRDAPGGETPELVVKETTVSE